ncbi:MAG TPA: adenylate/guanylate cyclase domain-containing protein [Candidatus Binatia bacterium]|nr:adenylate/guanylate cyclase domain-containing protein [Candidatus Binatia bacterium]
MTFEEILAQVWEQLQREGRVAYRILKRRFALSADDLEDLKADLIDAKRVAVDEDGKVLLWVGEAKEDEKAERAEGKKERDAGPRTPDSGLSSGERRQLTVMFCDLVGSTALSEQLDPEELREVVRGYQQVSAEVIGRFEGHIAQYLGDGLLVYFGYPTAHEDDAQRAVRAGLEIITVLQQWVPLPYRALINQGSTEGQAQSRARRQAADISLPHGRGSDLFLPHRLQVRIGIHTGPVVVGEMGGGGKREQLALGETPNIAARMQGIAEPNTVVISAATQRLVEGLFECQDLGPQTLKGISIPLSVYRVVKEGTAQSRFEVAVGRGLTPLVGREEELGLLRRRWAQAKEGAGQIALLTGEAGIGKSRLVQELKEQVTIEGATRIEFRCSPYHQNSAFYPLIEHLQRLLQFAPHDTSQVKLTKLQEALAAYHFPQADTLPLLASLLSLPHPEGAPPLTLSPQKQKQKTQEALVAWIVEEAEQAAVFCTWEDLHWADPSTLELLALYLEQIPTTQIFTILTCRPEFIPPWRPHSHITQLTLSRLGRQQVESMVERVTRGKALPAAVLQQIVAKTDGVPLFVEELTKMVLESGLLREGNGHYVGAHGSAPIPPLAIPSTLQDSLMARLDRLATVREVVQLGATLGREFTYELLQAVSLVDEVTLQKGLTQLVEAEFLYQRGLPPQAKYIFKHALIQDAAYQSLLKSKRQQLHRQIAQVLEEQFPETTETQPELLAHHYTEASLIAQAIPYWQRAGERAVQGSASAEAISHLTKGLELLKVLPETLERNEQELSLQITLGSALMAVKGLASPETERTYNRARELCQQVGETLQLFPVLYGLCGSYTNRAELLTARELGEQLLSLAWNIQDPSPLVAAHLALGQTLFWLGEFALALEHAERSIALYNPQQHRSHAFLYGQDSGVTCLLMAAAALWNLGYPDQARKRIREALTLAQELSHSYSLALALFYAGLLHQFRQEGPATQERVGAVMALCSEEGFPFLSTRATILRGWVLATQGETEEGIVHIRRGMAALRIIGVEFGQSHFLALLAEAYGKGKQTKEGLTVLAEALDFVSQTEERFYEAELYRLKGQLTLQKLSAASGQLSEKSRVSIAYHDGTVAEAGTVGGARPTGEGEAEACFLKALDIARKQQAKSLELRAATSLARLWQQQGKQAAARQLLAEIYGWFTEGFDTKDLQEAKALLEELGQ